MGDFDGNGVHRVKIGCGGELEYVEKVSNDEFVNIKEVADYLNEEFVEKAFVLRICRQ